MKAGDHGPDELYYKYVVVKSKHVITHHTAYGREARMFMMADEITNKDEFVFVMCPERDDQAAIAALVVYADKCEATYPRLAEDIRRRLRMIENG